LPWPAFFYLYVEKQFTGRQVQLAHMQLAREKQPWPVFVLPTRRGEITVRDVLVSLPDPARDEMIHGWCISVWNAFSEDRSIVSEFLSQHGII
jgi:Family of unknown function (DUF5946)